MTGAAADTVIDVPRSAAELILLQRTGHSFVNRIPVVRRLLPAVGYRPVLRWEAKVRASAIADAYAREVEKEFEQLVPHLPEHVHSVVDIGCGVGGMAARLTRAWGPNGLKVHLADRSHIEQTVWYGFEPRAAFYNSLELASQVVSNQGFGQPTVYEVDGVSDEIGFGGRADLVISLLSWGYHYPIDFYWERVMGILTPGGTLVLDVREGSGGLEQVRENLDVVATMPVPSGTRLVARTSELV